MREKREPGPPKEIWTVVGLSYSRRDRVFGQSNWDVLILYMMSVGLLGIPIQWIVPDPTNVVWILVTLVLAAVPAGLALHWIRHEIQDHLRHWVLAESPKDGVREARSIWASMGVADENRHEVTRGLKWFFGGIYWAGALGAAAVLGWIYQSPPLRLLTSVWSPWPVSFGVILLEMVPFAALLIGGLRISEYVAEYVERETGYYVPAPDPTLTSPGVA